MLTSEDKKRRVQWAKQHKNDDFKRTIFTDESSFQLFRNTIRRWTKHPKKELKCAPKNYVKNCEMSMKKRCVSLISSKGERIKY